MTRCMAMVVATLVPGAVCAQGTAQGWPGLDTVGLSTVYVRDDAGTETSGKLLRLDADSIVLLVGTAEYRLEAARVRRVEKRGDSLRNGALIGAVAGAAVGLIAAGISDCPGKDPGGSCGPSRATAFVLSTGVYAAIGAGLDALVVGRTTLYEAPTTPPRSERPVEGRQATITLRLRW